MNSLSGSAPLKLASSPADNLSGRPADSGSLYARRRPAVRGQPVDLSQDASPLCAATVANPR